MEIDDPAAVVTAPATRSPVTVALGGAVIVVCAVVAMVAEFFASPVLAESRAIQWGYMPMVWPMLLALATAGAAVVVNSRGVRAAALLAAVLAAHLTGLGLIAVRSWFTLPGAGWRFYSVTPITCATVTVIATSIAAATAVALAWREPAGGRRGLLPARPVLVVAGLVVLIVLPWVWDAGFESGDLTRLRENATLAWSLPWGAGLAAAGWMRGRSGRTAGILVVTGLALWLLAVAAVHLYLNLYPPTPD